MTTPMSVMLFAAGFGTRMGALTANTPKPLIKVAGRALIDHTLDLATEISPPHIVANTHYLHADLERHLSPKGVLLSHETPEILETGGGLRAALGLLQTDPVITMNTDAIWSGPNPITLLRNRWDPDKMDALLVCIPPKNAAGHASKGDFSIADDGRLTRGQGHIFGGIQIVKTDQLNDIKETAFSLNLLWNEMLKTNRLFGISYPGKWCDVGHPDGIPLAEDMLGYRDV